MTGGQEGKARAAFAAHMRGIEPEPVELATAPVLDMWQAVVEEKEGDRSLVIKGYVTGHPVQGSGDITTSPVIWLDARHRWCRTRTRLYRLDGKVIDEESFTA